MIDTDILETDVNDYLYEIHGGLELLDALLNWMVSNNYYNLETLDNGVIKMSNRISAENSGYNPELGEVVGKDFSRNISQIFEKNILQVVEDLDFRNFSGFYWFPRTSGSHKGKRIKSSFTLTFRPEVAAEGQHYVFMSLQSYLEETGKNILQLSISDEENS